ncbi:hypothetical protein HYC85_016468 [Camellia sinensis]|uniref:SKP1 component dimerisation domain-containing protein n=1 Tax=Camellia sinensis TaxID=4442 RepID=A0A7J7GZY5_CAMSI|nr:hypothetical protein HYC85_016468 [Camellia sinensis]
MCACAVMSRIGSKIKWSKGMFSMPSYYDAVVHEEVVVSLEVCLGAGYAIQGYFSALDACCCDFWVVVWVQPDSIKAILQSWVGGRMMKSYIWLETADGSIQQVEQEVAMFCPMICHEIHTGMGSSKNYPISLPPRVSPSTLSLILDYCRFHQVPGRSNKERKSFDEKFIRMDTKRLCELTSAADSLQLKPLVDLTSRALARMIEGKTPEEIRDTFHLPDDLTEEEKA